MKPMTTDWETGEIVTLQRIDKMLKKNRTTAYKGQRQATGISP